MKKFYSFYYDIVRMALQSIWVNKLRTFLTLIGIIIGVASVVVVGASIDGLNSYVVSTISKVLGVNHFMIARMAASGNISEEEWEEMNRRNKRLTIEDFEWLKEHCNSCTEVGAQADSGVDLKQDGQDLYGVRVAGVTANMVEIENKTIQEGRFILPHEVDHSSFVCVIGVDVKDKFFVGVDPIGKMLKVNDIPMRVIGVEEKRGSILGQSFDKTIYVPLTTFGRLFGRRQSLQLHGKAANREQFMSTIEEARTALRNYHKLKSKDKDDFGLVNVEQLNNQIDQFTGGIALVVIPITFISLVVGGIVVMNIMLVCVTERTFEIGLRKALGAQRKQILLQFLVESTILSSFGGLLGLLTAVGVAKLISSTTAIPMTVSPFYMILSVTFSGGIGLIFGIYPAYRASKLDPIRALTKN